jgi:hypothetical protein
VQIPTSSDSAFEIALVITAADSSPRGAVFLLFGPANDTRKIIHVDMDAF